MKAKSGKAVKAAKTAKTAVETPDPQAQVAGAHLDKPAAVEHPAAGEASGVTQAEAGKVEPGTVALVSKGAEKIPVQLKDEAHLARLQTEFGVDCVEVQS